MNALHTAFLGYLTFGNKELLPVLQAHLEDQEGELLPHVLLADIARWMLRNLELHANRIVVTRILKEFESRFDENEDFQSLIVCGFLENLPYPDEDGAAILKLLGPKMTAYLLSMR